MAQYTLLTVLGAARELTDGTNTFRLQARQIVVGGVSRYRLFFDQAITATGFTGVEGTDWDAIESHELPGGVGSINFRVGTRNEHWVIDQVYHPPIVGFDGDEEIDWDEITKYQLI